MPKPKANMSFSESRKALFNQMSEIVSKEKREVVIPFSNNDVPEFLKSLDEFEKKSRKNNIIVK